MPLEPIVDSTLYIEPTAELIEFIKHNVTDDTDAPTGIRALRKDTNNEFDSLLKVNDIKWLNGYLMEYRKSGKQDIYLHNLLQNVEIKFPKPKLTPRNPELEARIQKLKAQQDAIEYQAMTKNIDSTRKDLPEDTIAYQIKQINKQLIAVAQFVFSVIAGFAFGFVGVELLFGSLDFGFRLLLGIICALVIALAEIYFLAIKLNEDCIETSTMSKPKKLHQE